MDNRHLSILAVILGAIFTVLASFGPSDAFGQNSPTQPITPAPPVERRQDQRRSDDSSSISETMTRMQIERRNKEYRQMIERSEEAMKLAAEIERVYEQNGRLGREEISKLNEIEKLVKRVRSDLGGSDDKDEAEASELNKLAPSDIVKNLAETTARLYDELKKTTKHSISAAAIATSNTALRVARLLKIMR